MAAVLGVRIAPRFVIWRLPFMGCFSRKVRRQSTSLRGTTPRGIIEYAVHLGVGQGLDLALARPPYKSNWVAHVPKEKDLAAKRGPRTSGRSILWEAWDSRNFEHATGDFGHLLHRV